MLRVCQHLAALISLLLASCAAPNRPIVLAPAASRDVPETAAANVHRYVAKHRGWSRRAYHIERYPDDEGHAVFAVVHRRDESARPFVGRGKSFALYCDPRSYRVIKEMWFQ